MGSQKTKERLEECLRKNSLARETQVQELRTKQQTLQAKFLHESLITLHPNEKILEMIWFQKYTPDNIREISAYLGANFDPEKDDSYFRSVLNDWKKTEVRSWYCSGSDFSKWADTQMNHGISAAVRAYFYYQKHNHQNFLDHYLPRWLNRYQLTVEQWEVQMNEVLEQWRFRFVARQLPILNECRTHLAHWKHSCSLTSDQLPCFEQEFMTEKEYYQHLLLYVNRVEQLFPFSFLQPHQSRLNEQYHLNVCSAKALACAVQEPLLKKHDDPVPCLQMVVEKEATANIMLGSLRYLLNQGLKILTTACAIPPNIYWYEGQFFANCTVLSMQTLNLDWQNQTHACSEKEIRLWCHTNEETLRMLKDCLFFTESLLLEILQYAIDFSDYVSTISTK